MILKKLFLKLLRLVHDGHNYKPCNFYCKYLRFTSEDWEEWCVFLGTYPPMLDYPEDYDCYTPVSLRCAYYSLISTVLGKLKCGFLKTVKRKD